MHLFEANLLSVTHPTRGGLHSYTSFWRRTKSSWPSLTHTVYGRQLRSELRPIASARVHYVCVALPRVPYARPGTRVASMTTMFGHHSRGRSAFLGTSSPRAKKKTDPEAGPRTTARSFGSPLFLSSYFAFILRAVPLVSPDVQSPLRVPLSRREGSSSAPHLDFSVASCCSLKLSTRA